MQTKECSKCHIIKPLEDFYPSPKCKFGRRGSCKRCENLQSAAHQKATGYRYNYSPEQKAARLAYEQKRNQQPEVRARRRETTRVRYSKTPLARLARASNWHRRHKPLNKISAFDLWKIAKKQRLICPYSGQKLTSQNTSIDHIIPISKGGLNVPENIQLTLAMVNRMKSDYTEANFISMCKSIAAFRSLARH